MLEMPKLEEIEERITSHLAITSNEREIVECSIAWDGYISALLEWRLISIEDHEHLFKLLPPKESKVVQKILLGTDPG